MSRRLILLHGPNLNLLGRREPEIYGNLNQEALRAQLEEAAGITVELFQSNHEGALIDFLQNLLPQEVVGVVFNPGAFTHYSYALYDCVRSIEIPVVEVHLSDISAREEFRKVSVIAPACRAQFWGGGIESYKKAADLLRKEDDDV